MPRRIVPQSLAATLSAMVIVAIASLFTGQANAQVSGATLTGTVSDPSGAAIGNAKVAISNKATGVNRETTTDSAGIYTAPNLLPGVYDVTASSAGFSASKQADVTLTVGALQVLNLSLKIGEASQTVEVTGAAALVQLGSSQLSSEVDSATILQLPLNGRDWASLATLTPGVMGLETQMPFDAGAVRGNRGFGAQLTISGGRPTQNNYRLDGLSINDYGNGGPGSVLGVSLGVDALSEFSVVTGGYSAEYGRTSGGVINASSKSGTNAFHGDLYEFVRNDALDANSYILNQSGVGKAPFTRNQFGGAVGGPIRKDKTFFFFDYEGIRQSKGFAQTSNVPSPDARLGIIAGKPALSAGTSCQPGGHNLAPGRAAVCVDDNIVKFLGLYPLPNGPVSGDKGKFAFSGTRVGTENFYTTRVDHRISDRDSLFGTYMFDKTPYTQPDAFNNVGYQSQTKRYITALEETHIFSPTLLNSARLGFNRNAVINNSTVVATNPLSADTSLGVFAAPYNDNPNVRLAGFTTLNAGLNGGLSLHNWNSYQFYDDAFLTKGKHSLKMGFALENMRYNFLTNYNPEGIARFNSGFPSKGLTALMAFLENQPNSLEGGGLLGGFASRTTPRGLRQTLWGGYIQDDWKVRPHLTLNIGLRYEMTTVLSEVQGKLTNLRQITDPLPYCGTTDPKLTQVFGTPGCTGVAADYTNPTTHNFEPRFGFAWDPRGNGKTAIRGGFAIFDVLPLPGYFYTQQGIMTPFYLVGTVSAANAKISPLIGVPASDPSSAFSQMGPAAAPASCHSPMGTCSLTAAFMEPNPRRNYIEQWNLNVQHQITNDLTATVGYIGSHGVHMMQRGDDADMVLPTEISPNQWLWPYNPTGKDLRVNPNFGTLRYMLYGTTASYKALTVNVQKRLSHGYQFGGSYTLSRAMDDDSATIAGDSFSNSITSWFWFAPRISHAVSDFNVTHSVAINGLWQVPGPKGGLAGAVLGGWQLGGILKMNSGITTTPLIAGDPMKVQNNGSDTFGIPDMVPGCNPVNSNYKANGYINYACYTLPKATPAIAAQCVPFSGVPFAADGTTPTCSNLLGNAGRNSIVGPPLVNLDFSLAKNFAIKKISETFSVQLRAEFFNALNHANFLPPLAFQSNTQAQLFNTDGTSLNAGALDTMATDPRDVQFGIKIIF